MKVYFCKISFFSLESDTGSSRKCPSQSFYVLFSKMKNAEGLSVELTGQAFQCYQSQNICEVAWGDILRIQDKVGPWSKG